MIIRYATPDDAPAIAAIHVASWRASYEGIVPADYMAKFSVEKRTAHFREALTARTDRAAVGTIVADLDGELAGFCTFGQCRDEDKPKDVTGEIWGIYLAPHRWRQGIGGQLVAWAEGEFRQRGKTEAVLWVLEANANSRRFYEAMGYVADGTSKTLQFGIPLVAVRYAKKW